LDRPWQYDTDSLHHGLRIIILSCLKAKK
jgi:hypothetical protein